MKQKTIALVDGNNFFASCEILMNPFLEGKPVCVLSNNDGCIIARSNEAKKLGIKMGMPYFMAKKEFNNAVYLSANFELYHEISCRMIKILSQYSDKLDIYSIDEAFLDLTNADKIYNLTFSEIALNIKDDIKNNIGIPVSVGIANSKILAKLATYKAKKAEGTYYIEKHLIKNELINIPVEEIWGIGRNTARQLRKFGIFYADEIPLKDDNFYKHYFGKKGMELKYELIGESVIPLTGIAEKPKSLQRTRAFPEFSNNKQYIITELSMHLHNICKKLRENNQTSSLISVMLRTKDFKVYYKECALDFYSNSEIMLMNKVISLFKDLYKENIIYRSSEIFAGNLKDKEKEQLSLFENKQIKQTDNLSLLIDKMEYKYGKGTISLGEFGLKNTQKEHKRKIGFPSL